MGRSRLRKPLSCKHKYFLTGKGGWLHEVKTQAQKTEQKAMENHPPELRLTYDWGTSSWQRALFGFRTDGMNDYCASPISPFLSGRVYCPYLTLASVLNAENREQIICLISSQIFRTRENQRSCNWYSTTNKFIHTSSWIR